MANELLIVAGPPGGGKSRWIRDQLSDRPRLILIDYTRIFAAVTGEERDPETGRYPIRQTGDPRLAFAAAVFYQAVERAAFTGREGFVTTAKPESIDRLKEIGNTNRVRIIDPGEAVARQNLDDLYRDLGYTPDECTGALAGWYESSARRWELR